MTILCNRQLHLGPVTLAVECGQHWWRPRSWAPPRRRGETRRTRAARFRRSLWRPLPGGGRAVGPLMAYPARGRTCCG